jgi:hypothetical protein
MRVAAITGLYKNCKKSYQQGGARGGFLPQRICNHPICAGQIIFIYEARGRSFENRESHGLSAKHRVFVRLAQRLWAVSAEPKG